MTIGERIKQLRKALKLTQQKFADRLNVGQSTIGAYESGQNTPSSPTLTLICREFGASKDWLLTGEGPMFRPDAPEPVDHLGELMRQYNVIPEARVLIEKFLELEPRYQEALLVYARSVAAALSAEGAPVLSPEEEAAAEAREYYREVLEEKKAAAKSSVSSEEPEGKTGAEPA